MASSNYSYFVMIICLHTVILFQVVLTGTITLVQSRPLSNSNEGVLYIPLSSRTSVLCSTQEIPLQGIHLSYSKPCQQDYRKMGST